ncbi:MAG: peptide deformylase, partial [Cetobacterium sp.]
MALRQIVQIGEPVLRKKCKVVDEIDEKIIQLLDDMADTMYEADGVGLAAPQVGILKRIAIIDVGEGIIELINPEIVETSGTQTDDEGCLSVVNECGPVTRPYYVKVRAYNRNGQMYEIEGEELLARA